MNNKKRSWLFLSVVSIISITIYWMTAYPTITWWDNSSYSIAANCLGVESPPGSLILTILGWFVIKLSFFQSKIFTLNLFAGVLAVGTLIILFKLTVFLFDKTQTAKNYSNYSLLSLSLAILIFSFSETFWTYSTQFTPYILTALMTALILYQLIRFWFEEDTQKIIYLVLFISFLFGLDFSIHRTNTLLIPGFISMIFLKDIKLFLKLKFWIAGATGLIAGLAVHLLKIAMASADPIVNFNNPDNLSRFYDYVSLKQYGGGFLTDVFTRKAPIISVQTYDYFKTLYDNFISFESPLGFVSVFTIMLVLFGIYSLYKSSRKTALMLIMLYLITTAMTIFYFNIPENFFRSLARHYLPSFVIFTVFIAYGASMLFGLLKNKSTAIKSLSVTLVLILFLLPLNQIIRNYKTLDGSNDSFAYDYANNILDSLRPDAVLFVMGDVFYPLFYMQQVEGKRPDIDILSISLTNTPWYQKQLMSNHYQLPLVLTTDEINSMTATICPDTIFEIPFEGDLPAYQIESLDSLTSTSIQMSPTFGDKYVMAQDWFVLKLIEANKWDRPIYFTQPVPWLNDFSRPEGLVFQLIPQSPADINVELLKRNLMENYKYDGYTDHNRPLEFSSKGIGENLWNQFIQLAMYQKTAGDTTAAKATIEYVKSNLPLERIARSEKSLERFNYFIKQIEN